MSASAHDLNLLLAGGLKKLKAEIDQANAELRGYTSDVFQGLQDIVNEMVKLRDGSAKLAKRVKMVELALVLSNQKREDQEHWLLRYQGEVEGEISDDAVSSGAGLPL